MLAEQGITQHNAVKEMHGKENPCQANLHPSMKSLWLSPKKTWSKVMKLKLENIQNFLKENAECLRGLADHRDTSIGFNAFALVSDTYRKENFHSDIIAAILNPSSPHGEGDLFLRLFLEHLIAVARNQGKEGLGLADELSKLPLKGQIEVKREDGRVDIQIKAPDWTIIIENKINGAVDMELQLPRYLEACGGTDRVKAFVYLTASEPKEPDVRNWPKKERMWILSHLINLVGFSETKPVRNLVDGWLDPCEKAAKEFAARAVLNQYSELVRKQAGETMNQNELKGLLDSLSKNKIPYTDFRQAIEALPHTLALVIVEKIKSRGKTKLEQAKAEKDGCFLTFEAVPAGSSDSVRYAIDINLAALEDEGVSFWARDDRLKGGIRACESLVKSSGLDFKYNESWMRFVWTPPTNEVFGNIDAFFAKIDRLVSVLEKNWAKLETIAKENSP